MIGSSDFQDIERTLGLAFIDEDLTFTSAEMRPADVSFLDEDDIREIHEEEDEA